MSSTTVSDKEDLAGPSLKNEDNKEEIERPSSPDPPCAICLSELTNKSYTDSCLHTFCFDCLKEWAQIKAECPLCKQRFTTIIHNIRSLNDYDEHRINPVSGLGVSSRFYDMLIDPANFRRYIQPGRFRRTQGSILYLSDAPMIPSYAVLPTSIEFRRAIYHEGLWVRSNRSNRQRECSPEFYRNNEAQTHRLLPWLSRELSVLLDVSMNVHTVCDHIMRLLVLHPITSSSFRNYILTYVGPRTDHFLHEFYNYAISPEPTMQIYDFNAEYSSINSSRLRHGVHRSFMLNGIRGLTGAAHFNSTVLSNSRLPNLHPEVVFLSDSSDSSDVEPVVQNNEAIVNDTDSDESVLIIEPPTPKPIEVITLDDSDISLPEAATAASSVNVHEEDIYANPQPSTSFQHENRIPLIVLSSSSSMSSSSPCPSPSSAYYSSAEDSPPRPKKKSRSSKKHKRKTKRSHSPSPKRKRRERKSYRLKSKKSKKNDKENESSTKCERRQSFSYSSSDEDVPRSSFLRSVVLKCNKNSLKMETDSSPDSDF